MTGKKKSKGKLKRFIPFFCFVLLGAVCGGLIFTRGGIFDTASGEVSLTNFAILLVSMYAAMYLQIAVHEAGHLLFGLLTGYEFLSYRIGKLMIVKQNGKLSFKKYSLAGTGGQCLMAPPEMKNGRFPVVLYNLGGSILNLISCAISAALYFIFENIPVASTVFLISAITGLLYALLNGVPMNLGTIDNDGQNALSIRKSEKSMQSFHIQLLLTIELTNGKKLKDMPEEWFAVPSDEEMKNSISAAIGVFCCNRFMDMQNFTEAERLITHLISIDSGIVGIHRNLLLCDLLYCKLISKAPKEKIDELLTKDMKKILKASTNNPSALRTQYAYALIDEKNEKKAEKIKKKFNKVLATYPYDGDAQSERELLRLCMQKAEPQNLI